MTRGQTDAPSPAVTAAARRLGIERLYPEQRRIVEDVLGHQDVLAVLPTGFGKSACYQIPSMVLPQPVVVISPLVALLQDQEQKLLKRDVPVARLDGTVRGKKRREIVERIANGGPILVMTTPETFGSGETQTLLANRGIGLVAVDEAHCISEWGHDFRPAYLRLGEHLRNFAGTPIMALTATATEKVREDIVRFLGLRDPHVIASSPHRSNLAFEVVKCRGDMRARALMRLIQRLRRPGIVYCTTTREVDSVYTVLRRLGIPAHHYHGKMNAGDRKREQELYMKGGRRVVMVATSAFGLGIDKPDIRYIIHQNAPASLEQYVQEAGRAGRDGRRADCVLLYDEDDRAIHELLLSKSRVRPDQLYKLGSALAAWAGEGRTPERGALALSAGLGPRIGDALLAVLAEAELVRIDDKKVEIVPDAASVEDEVRSLAGRFATLRTQDGRRLDTVAQYAGASDCRAVFLRRYFGEEQGEPCGLCDMCRGRLQRAPSFFEPVLARPGRAPRRGRRRDQRKRVGRGGAQAARGAAPAPQPPPPREQRHDRQAQAAAPGTVEPGKRRRRSRRRRRRAGAGGDGAAPPPPRPRPTIDSGVAAAGVATASPDTIGVGVGAPSPGGVAGAEGNADHTPSGEPGRRRSRRRRRRRGGRRHPQAPATPPE